MRWLIFACALVALFTTFAAVSFVDFPDPEDEQVPLFAPQHQPETPDEQAAARVVLAYLQAMSDQRPPEACRLVARPLEYTLRCATRPRDDLQVSAGKELRVAHIKLRDSTGEAWVSGASPGPLLSVSFARVGHGWRVVQVSGGFGLA